MESPSALPEDGAPSASLGRLEARGAPAHPSAPPQQLGSVPWLQEPASGRPKVEDFPFVDWQVEQLVRALDKKAGRTDKVGLPLSPRSRKAAEAAGEEAGQAAAAEEKAKEKEKAEEEAEGAKKKKKGKAKDRRREEEEEEEAAEGGGAAKGGGSGGSSSGGGGSAAAGGGSGAANGGGSGGDGGEYAPEVGDRVKAHFGVDEDELWFPGTVHKVRKDGSVDVAYDDGDFEKRKPLARVRPLPPEEDDEDDEGEEEEDEEEGEEEEQ